jgi:hypothetical protein
MPSRQGYLCNWYHVPVIPDNINLRGRPCICSNRSTFVSADISQGHQMDIMTGLATIGQAIKTVKDLKDIEAGLDAAAYKTKMADLYGTLAEVKMSLTDAKETIHDRDFEIKNLKSELAALKSGDACPICQSGTMKVISSKAHQHFGIMGVQERTLKCQKVECSYSEQRIHDPDNRTGANGGR